MIITAPDQMSEVVWSTHPQHSMINLRKAHIGDLRTLRYWDTQEHVIAADPDDDWNWEVELLRDPAWREQLIAELDGHPVGFVQIIDPAEEETRYWGDIDYGRRAIDIWIGDRHNLGKGYGTQMMQQALERCFGESDVTEVLIDPLVANGDAIRFYQRLGFEFVENRRFGSDYCAVHSISREKWLRESASKCEAMSPVFPHTVAIGTNLRHLHDILVAHLFQADEILFGSCLWCKPRRV